MKRKRCAHFWIYRRLLDKPLGRVVCAYRCGTRATRRNLLPRQRPIRPT